MTMKANLVFEGRGGEALMRKGDGVCFCRLSHCA